MNRPIIVADADELGKLAHCLPKIAGELEGKKYVPMLSSGLQQLIILDEGKPVFGYRIPTIKDVKEDHHGTVAIEHYLEKLDEKKHLVMLYDDPTLARRVEFLYLSLGLTRNEECVYVIPEDDTETPYSIQTQMEYFGIAVAKHLSNRSLIFRRITDPAKDPGGFVAGCKRILETLLNDEKKPIRMVLHVRYQFNSKEEINGHALFEDLIESNFADFPGSMLCNHYVGKNTEISHGEWTRKMLQTHDGVFLVSSEKTSSFFTALT